MVIPSVAEAVASATAAGAAGVGALRRRLPPPRRAHADPGEAAAFAALHLVARAAPSLRAGLTEDAARPAARRLRALLGAEAVALVAVRPRPARTAAPAPARARGGTRPGCWPGTARAAAPTPPTPSGTSCPSSRRRGPASSRRRCSPAVPRGAASKRRWSPRSPSRDASRGRSPRTGRARRRRASARSARPPASSPGSWSWPGSTPPGSGSPRPSGGRCAPRSPPHFVYNSLTTIASFVRTDPDRARGLLLDFADFARYSFRNPRDFTTLADELRSLDRYLLLERARFGDRLRCRVEIAPEVLPVAVPFLALQPLVENAIRHGMAGEREAFHISIVARDSGAEAAISVEDDGVGMDPERLQEILSAPLGRPGPTGWGSVVTRARQDGGPGIGLANVDERMRQVYGDEYGLTVETALGAGTKVNLRVPKYRPGVFPE
ncbi:sensor histidine kinase [Actinomadura madurae]|uniref:sensor histidine kinase n=1 Tax=Actinomadura madurae TaxID=1993 RepID=UPI0032B0439B